MKAEFEEYLNAIGMTSPIKKKVEYFYCLCRDIAFEKLLDVFVDDYLNEDKSRVYTGLSFYSKNYTFSVPNFLTEDRIGILHHQTVQNRIAITVENFDFKKTNEKSLMSVELFRGALSTGIYKATQKNCIFLLRILRKYIKPSLRKHDVHIAPKPL